MSHRLGPRNVKNLKKVQGKVRTNWSINNFYCRYKKEKPN